MTTITESATRQLFWYFVKTRNSTTPRSAAEAFRRFYRSLSPQLNNFLPMFFTIALKRIRPRSASDKERLLMMMQECNTGTAVEPNPKDPVHGYISWLTEKAAQVQKNIDSIHSLDDHLETLKVFEATFLTQEEHEQKLETLQAEMHAIQQDEQDNIAIRNSIQPIIQRRGSSCAEEWRAALERCNKSL
ncbi:Ff.00g130670.m01.CDS01 [Fusarium sp. VM40]|nr:Ff.00g130670.m01.CDS01 [Fusarium sp. VM40]